MPFTDAQRDKLEVLTTRRQMHNERAKQETEIVDKLTTEIKELLAEAGEMGVDLDRWKVTLSTSGRSSIDKSLLLLEGVDTEIIERATKTSVSTSLRVTEKKVEGQL